MGVLLLAACCGGRKSDPSPAVVSPADTPTPAATALPTPDTALPSDWDGLTLFPAPAVGAPCPVESDVCEAAFDLLARVHANDADGILAASEPRTVTCPRAGEPLPINVFDPGDACSGAQAGEVRPYYVVSSGGEGSATSPSTFASALRTYVERLPVGAGSPDRYGPGGLALAAVGCFRTSGPSGRCGDEWITVTLTVVPAAERRLVACFTFHRNAQGGPPRLGGIGCGVPPYASLYGLSGPARYNELMGTFGNYPWLPLVRHPLPDPVKAAVEGNLPLAWPLDGECLVAPPSGEQALCFLDPVDRGQTFEVYVAIPFSDAVWKYVLRRNVNGTYSVESMVKQGI
ncbi:MAG: hypothetical protein U0837_11845 [Dehalococcoidia bacterium]|jgi:hypothetical protein